MPEQERVALRSTPVRAEADEWALVLAAEGLSPQLERLGGSFVLSVALSDGERADAALSEYDIEHLPEHLPAAMTAEPDSTWGITVSLGITAALLCFFVVTGERNAGAFWFVQGSAEAALILNGELWRCVTALTLHADMPHVVGNAIFGALFMAAALRVLGPGLGSLMVLASGAVGNLANVSFSIRGASV